LILTVVQVLQTAGFLILALLCIMFMIVVHEFGHYLAGRLLGFKIIEFSIGMGPAIYQKKNKKTEEIFSIRSIPIGGYCQFEDDEDNKGSKTAFNNQHPFKRIIVLLSGALFNLLSALLLIIIFFNAYGQILPSVNEVFEDSVNVNTLKNGDVFLKINNKNVNILTQDDINSYFKANADEMSVIVLRNGKKEKLTLKSGQYQLRNEDGDVEKDENGQPIMKKGYGFIIETKQQKLPFFVSIGKAFSFMFFVVYKIFVTIGGLFFGKIPFVGNVGGPIATISTMTKAVQTNFSVLFYMVCLLSANLAVFNLLPIPALDGSKILFTLIEWIFKKPVNRKVEAILTIIGFVFLLGMAIVADVFYLRA